MRITNNHRAAAARIIAVAEAANRCTDGEAYHFLQEYAGLLAERLKEQALREGARVWISEGIANLGAWDIPCPGEVIEHLVPVKPWPRAQQGDTIQFEGHHYVVAVNTTTRLHGHYHIGIYVIEPVDGYLVRLGAEHAFDPAYAADDTVV